MWYVQDNIPFATVFYLVDVCKHGTSCPFKRSLLGLRKSLTNIYRLLRKQPQSLLSKNAFRKVYFKGDFPPNIYAILPHASSSPSRPSDREPILPYEELELKFSSFLLNFLVQKTQSSNLIIQHHIETLSICPSSLNTYIKDS